VTTAVLAKPGKRGGRRILLEYLRRYFVRSERSWVKELRLWLLPRLARLFISALMGTCRLRLAGFDTLVRLQQEGRGVVFVGWHDKLLVSFQVLQHRGFYAFTSRSRVGELLTRIFETFGWNAIRGSTTSGGSHALRAAVRELRQGKVVCLTPDGPNGPRHECQPGAVYIAAMAQSPVIAFGAAAAPRTQARTWDRHMIPLPFARVAIVVSQPLYLPQHLTKEQTEKWAQQIRDLIDRTEREAERVVKG
jgi:hypothetical protein